ncbi:hypothetical protein MTR67_050158 [Solanum verrucosum]|uniref:ADP-ribosyl cyclase/cyclic ADP-ribose hydrolase n=1 Tax=Solanum verrucosum TaxID=315347 RepID=A0AAF0V4V3_SOLVR|nr:hypothetical protein MTR67_050158 [Solanum verrucosum]
MSHASSSKVWKYDIFLSFRGEDTRRTFVSHLYNALEQRGIPAFKDDERLEAGKSISAELLKAIEEARFTIVIPVFYDVSPSDVRHQNPPFADSFSQHEVKYKDDMENVQRWRGAFVEAGKILGYHLLNFKNEADCIKKLVDDIFPKSLQVISPFPESLVEIANVLHQRYRHLFEADCFLGDVGELHQKNGLTWLQQVIIFKLLGKEMPLTSKHEGMNILKNMLCWKKVLFILDDVNHREQLEFLVGGPEWFGMGSRIILTARDKHLLISHIGDNVYEVQLLSEDEALELFSRHAFREKTPKKDFMELSRQVVKHAGGLPLALKVLGSSFYRRDKKHWRHIIDRLKRIPHKDILGKLRLSFDGLDKDEKELFLDIAFLDIACLTRDNFNLCVELVRRDASRGFLIECLNDKSLLSIDWNNSIVTHNMIREMGENVIRDEYANSRIWLPEEVCDLFKGKLITEKVENLCIPKDYYFEDDFVNYSNIFKRMQSLKILIVGDGTFSSNCAITYLPSSLRFIDWPGFPSYSLPESFEPSQLVVLCLCKSWLAELCSISKTTESEFYWDKRSAFIHWESELNLIGCEDLVSLPDNIRNLMNLQRLSLRGCKKLEKLPENICDLQELDMLEDLGSLHSFEKLDNLNELPSGELPPNLMLLFADYHLALKSIRDLVNNCLKLYRLEISNRGAVSSEQVNVFVQHFLRTCIQFDFHQRGYFLISIPGVRIPELFDYDCHFVNQEKMSIELNPSWYTNKFMGFWICYGPTALDKRLEATLVCKSDPERKYSLKCYINQYCGSIDHIIYCVYIPFETLWNNGYGNKM